jgi:aspartyl protease family protein
MKPLLGAVLLALAGTAAGQTVSMSGKLGDKALLVIDGTPKTLSVGATAQGVKLVAVTADGAVVEVGGKRLNLAIGAAQVNLGSANSAGGGTRIVLSAGTGGHFVTDGTINGHSVRFLVDTGATNVSIGRAEAQRMGIDWKKGQRGYSMTANGTVEVHRVRLATVRIGDVTVYDVDATVSPASLPVVLLGNSFLSRFQMKRENDLLTLDKRF